MPFVLFSFIEGIKFAAPHEIVIHQTEHNNNNNNFIIHQKTLSYIKTELEICKGLSINQDMTVPIKKGLFQLRRAQRLKERIRQTVPPQKLASRILRCSHPLVPIATLRLKLTQMFVKEITIPPQ